MIKLSDLTPEQREEAKRLTILGSRESFKFWFETCAKIRVKDPSKPLETPTLNAMQRKIVAAVEWCDAHGVPARLINLKPRQGGSSSLAIAMGYHRVRSGKASCAILGDDKNTTSKLFEMWRRYGENDAMDVMKGWDGGPTNAHQPSWETFTNGGSLTLETANDPRAGQGGTFSVLIASEVASYRASGHSTGEDVFSSIAGCVPKLPKTLVILESTAQGQSGIFYSTYQGGVTFEEFKAGKRGNGYIRFFTSWFEFDDYQFDGKEGRQAISEWQREAIQNSLDDREQRLISRFGANIITPERLAWRREVIAGPDCGGDPDKFAREYPSDDLECFRNSNCAFFDIDGLLWQEQQITPSTMQHKTGDITLSGKTPFFMPSATGQGPFRIWEMPEEGRSYVLAADFRVGRMAAGSKRELDCNAVLVIRAGYLDPVTNRVVLPRVVASVREDDRTDTDIILNRILCLHRFYGDCVVIPELNGAGNIVWQAQQLGITNIWSQASGAGGALGQGKTQTIYGFNTNVSTRRSILDKMAAMVREQAWICSCPYLLSQMKTFVRNETGKPEASAGTHDDLVMAAAIGLWIIEGGTVYHAYRGMGRDGMNRHRLERSKLNPRGV